MNPATDAILSSPEALPAPQSGTSQNRSTGSDSIFEQHNHGTSKVAILTGGGDKPYALGIAAALASAGMSLDFIGSDELLAPELLGNPRVNFLNLRGDQNPKVSGLKKLFRVLVYYLRLVRYTVVAKPKIFHILWNNKFQSFDRTLLMLFYRLFGKKIVLTVHNVNIGERDSNDSWFNRSTLKTQYRLCHHIFVHTERMKSELISQFALSDLKISVIPFGINNTVPNSALTIAQAKHQLGIVPTDKTLLFFGNIAPYKGLEYLLTAFIELARESASYRLIIAGRCKCSDEYWREVAQMIAAPGILDRVIQKIEFIPDEDTELYFKAADVLVLPYTHVFQSGVLSLGYSFGLPVIAADVGSLKEDIIDGQTGSIFPARDPAALAQTARRYFSSGLYGDLDRRRFDIKAYANDRYSWAKVASVTTDVYSNLFQN